MTLTPTSDDAPVPGRLKRLTRIGAALGLLGFMVYRVGPGDLWATLRSTSPLYLVLAFGVVCADNVLRAYNWRQLLAAKGTSVPFLPVFATFAVGGFFGSFVPSSLGPDAARAVALSRRRNIPIASAASSVIMLNLAGLWALGVLFLVGALGLAVAGEAPAWLSAMSLVAAGATVTITALLFTRRNVPSRGSGSGVFRRIAKFVRALAAYRDVRQRLGPVFTVATLNQGMAMLVFYLAFLASGGEVAPLYLVALVPAVTLARLVPASVAGFGAEQAVVVVLFSVAGVTAATALAASVVVSTLNLLFIASCGLLYATEHARALFGPRHEASTEPRRTPETATGDVPQADGPAPGP